MSGWRRRWRHRHRLGIVVAYSGCHSTVWVELNDGTRLTCMTYEEER